MEQRDGQKENTGGAMPSLAFLGAGRIAEAMVRGLLGSGLAKASDVIATDIREDRLDQLARELGIATTLRNSDAVDRADVVFLTVKPQDILSLLGEVAHHVRRDQLVVSVAAGVPIAAIEGRLHGPPPVVRVMPNTPALVGAGMAVLAPGTRATSEHEELVARIFGAVGRVVVLPEKYLDAVTALSGSGPGFLAVVAEALADGGVLAGLPRDVAALLTYQTMLGTARMLVEAKVHPAHLKEMVTSPGGTTAAGLRIMERGGLRGLLMEAVLAATERSRELGKAADGIVR